MSHWSTLCILEVSIVSPPVTVLSRQPGWVTPPSQNTPGNKHSTPLGTKSKSLPQPTRSKWCGLFSQFSLTSWCSPLTHSPASPPASGPLHFLYSLFACSSLNISQAHSLSPPGSLLKCHLLTHLEQLPYSHHPATPLQPLILLYFSFWQRQYQEAWCANSFAHCPPLPLEHKLPEVSGFVLLAAENQSNVLVMTYHFLSQRASVLLLSMDKSLNLSLP